MILYGAGGHAEVVYDGIKSQDLEITLVFDDDPSVKSFHRQEVISKYNASLLNHEKLMLSIGSNQARYKLAKIVKHRFGIVKHITAYVAGSSIIENGAMIMANAIVQVACRIGKHTIVNSGAIVEHHSETGDFAHIGPGAVICGGVHIGEGALIGANATVLPGITIGEWSTIGAGAVVRENVIKNSKVVGNPAKHIKT